MRIGLVALVIASMALIPFAACKQEATPTQESPRVQSIVDSLQFRRYAPLPSLCFGYTYVETGMGDFRTGGPAVVQVDCATVDALLPPEQRSPPSAERDGAKSAPH